VEEQLTAGLGEGQVAEFVEYDEVEPRQVIGDTALPATPGLALQSVDEVDDRVEATPCAAADTGSGNGYGEMRFTGTGSADQHGVALFGEKAAGRQVADQGLVDRRAGEVELVDVLGQRQLGDGQLVLDRARLLLGDLGAEQVAEDARRLVPALDVY